jgi:tRNA dimethylallyltransferase
LAARPDSLVVLVGATATGKTELALSLVDRFEGSLELVSLDSRQIYRELEIGTGKPDARERERLPHHLIDLIDPDETYDAGRYRGAVEELLPRLWERGVTPLLVGGAGFYLRALAQGFFDLPEDPEKLARLREEFRALDLEELRSRLAQVDPASARRLHPNDRYRIERALEIHGLSGRSMSELSAEFTARPVLGLRMEIHHLQQPRWQLHGRIARRARAWLEGGWIEETQALLEAGWAPDSPGLSILGYREIVEHLCEPGSMPRLEERVVFATRQYARQQEIWFRKLEVMLRATRENPQLGDSLLAALERSRPA